MPKTISSLFLTLAIAILCWMAVPAFAQTNQGASLPENRWLFIVETSRTTQRIAENEQQIVASLIASGAGGQMRKGDTVGVWTFNETLQTGHFPLQQWTPQSSRNVARLAQQFLQRQTYEKTGRLWNVTPELHELVEASEFLTVILVTDGQDKIAGTPFDEQINATFAEWQTKQAKAQMPFVTVLRAQHGTMTDFAVNTPPWPLQMPPLPAELQIARTKPPEPKPAEPQTARAPEKTKPRTTVPPLIVIGNKPTPVEPPPSAEPVTAAAPAATTTESVTERSSAPTAAMGSLASVPAGSNSAALRPPPAAVAAVPASAPERAEVIVSNAPSVAASAVPVPPTDSTTSASPVPPLATAPAATARTRATPAPVERRPMPAVPIEPFQRGLLISLGAGAGLLAAAAFLLARRSRVRIHSSLITRSFEHGHK